MPYLSSFSIFCYNDTFCEIKFNGRAESFPSHFIPEEQEITINFTQFQFYAEIDEIRSYRTGNWDLYIVNLNLQSIKEKRKLR